MNVSILRLVQNKTKKINHLIKAELNRRRPLKL